MGHVRAVRERWEQAFALFGGVVLIALVATAYVATWAHRAVGIAFYVCATVVLAEWVWRRLLRRKPPDSAES